VGTPFGHGGRESYRRSSKPSIVCREHTFEVSALMSSPPMWPMLFSRSQDGCSTGVRRAGKSIFYCPMTATSDRSGFWRRAVEPESAPLSVNDGATRRPGLAIASVCWEPTSQLDPEVGEAVRCADVEVALCAGGFPERIDSVHDRPERSGTTLPGSCSCRSGAYPRWWSDTGRRFSAAALPWTPL
jgi:hypothetical protein